MVKIKMQGVGTGKNDMIAVLSKNEIINIIKNTDMYDIAKLSIDNFVEGFKHGITVINMTTGKIYGYGIGQNEYNQAIDDQEIRLFKIDMNCNYEEEVEYLEFCGDYELLNYEQELEYKYSDIVR